MKPLLYQMYISQFRVITSIASELADSSSLGISSPDEDWFAKQCLHVLLVKNPDLASACTLDPDRKSTRLNSSHVSQSRMPSSA